MSRLLVNNACSVGIIYRASDPSHIFLERKDNTHPAKHARMRLCPIGGNWIGKNAKLDTGPRDTFRREVREELSLSRENRTADDLVGIGLSGDMHFGKTPINPVVVRNSDRTILSSITKLICQRAVTFATYINTVTKLAWQMGDETCTRETLSFLSTYFSVGLDEYAWGNLTRLQERYGNISAESLSVITTFEEIVASQDHFAFAHEFAFRDFFAWHNLTSSQFPITPHVRSKRQDNSFRTYRHGLRGYEIVNVPV